MKTSDNMSLKKMILYLDSNSLALQYTDPSNSDERKELKALDQKGLTKIQVIDTSASFKMDKRMLQKLVEDLSSRDDIFTEITDRSQAGHNLVQIYAARVWLRKFGLTPEQYQQVIREEDSMLETYEKPREK